MSTLINEMTPIKELIIHTDGGSRGNPGPSAIGVVISTSESNHIESYGKYIGITTNNQAEYQAVVDAVKAALKYKPEKVTFYLDSELVVKQLKGIYKVKNAEIKPLHEDILRMTTGMKVTFNHVLRKFNTLADIEVNKALDQQAEIG